MNSKTIKDLRRHLENGLRRMGVRESEIEATHILRHLFNCDVSWLIVHQNDQANENVMRQCESILSRRGENEPLAYILGVREFYGFEFVCSPAALIPRQETELIVDHAVKKLPRGGRLLDLGCGTGCIGISIAKTREDCFITLTDVSEDAIQLAKTNSERLSVSVQFAQGSWFDALSTTDLFHGIVSNPPYIHPDEKSHLSAQVLKEPHLALFHSDPISLYRDLASGASARLTSDGFFLAELSPRFASSALSAAEEFFRHCSIVSDYSGNERILFAEHPRRS